MSTPKEWPRPLSERPTPSMVEGLRLRHAHGSTRAGLVSRRLACPGGHTKTALSLTPLGQWVRELLMDLEIARASVVELRELLQIARGS